MDVSISDAKALLSELVERAATGETVRIMRRGKPVARIVAEEAPRKPINFEALQALRARLPPSEDGREFMLRFRDDERY